MKKQQRIMEIERIEAEMYPEADSTKGEAVIGPDGFSKAMEVRARMHTHVRPC
jgi:hypothetical protein